MRRLAHLALLLCSVSLGSSAFAKESDPPAGDEGGAVYAVEPRGFKSGHEFRIATGYLPQSAFYKGTTLEGSWAYHFTDLLSWEVLRGGYSWNHTTDLTRRLHDEFAVDNEPYQKAQYFLFSQVRLTPFHGKVAFFGRPLVQQEMYLLAGVGGVGWMNHTNGRADTPVNFRPAMNAGAGMRWHLSERFSVRLEALENFYQKPNGGIDDQVYINLGASISTRR